jgi:hypothetical protein
MTTRRFIALALPVLVVVGVLARGKAQDASPPDGTRIVTPDTWVPFTATVRQVKPRPGRETLIVVGRMVRAGNGSERLETGPENEPARVIDIKNIARALYFTTARDTSGAMYWVEQPMKLPAGGWKPPTMSERADRVRLKEKFDGREVVAVTVGPGQVNLMAPSLNFYPLVKTIALTGERIEAHVISTDEPSAELFEPPAGAEIRRSDKPSGIVFETREEAEARGVKFPIGKPEQH